MKRNSVVFIVFLLSVGLWLTCSAAITNVWISATGGKISDADNWQDGILPKDYAVLDFSALNAGEKIIYDSTNYLQVSGVIFGNNDSQSTDEWILTNSSWDFPFRIAQDGEFCVRGGTLKIAWIVHSLWSNYVRCYKTGSGTLTVCSSAGSMDYPFIWYVKEGSLKPNFKEAFKYNCVYVDDIENQMVFPYSAEGFHFGRLCDFTAYSEPPDLTGTRLIFGGWQQSTLRVPYENAEYLATFASTLHLGQAPTNVSLQVADGDVFVNDLPSEWHDCVGFWRFNVDDPSVDSGFRGNHLTKHNNWPIVTNDVTRGRVAYFNGTSGLKGIWNNGLNGQPTGSEQGYTMAFWAKPDDNAPDFIALFKFGNLVANECSFARIQGGNNRNQLYFSHGGGAGTTYSLPISGAAWHHYAFVCDTGHKGRFYLDGELVGPYDWSNCGTRSFKAQDFLIGHKWSDSSQNFQGMMDDVALFSRPLTAEEVVALRDVTIAKRPMAEDTTFCLRGTGRVQVLGDQTFTKMYDTHRPDNPTVSAGVSVAPNAVLTVSAQGTSNTSQVQYYNTTIDGEGSVTKDGENLDWVLSGVGNWQGETRVKAGTMHLRSITDDVAVKWDFKSDHPLRGFSALPCDLKPNKEDLVSFETDATRGTVARIKSGGSLDATMGADFPNGNDSFSLTMWTKLSSTCGNNATFCVWGENGISFGQLQFRLINSYQIVAFAAYGGLDFTDIKLPSPINDGKWHHLAITYNNLNNTQGVYRAYYDGAQLNWGKTETTVRSTIAEGKIRFGSCWDNKDRYFDGWIDSPCVWNRALSASEVAKVYADKNFLGESRPLPQPVAHYAFEDADNIGKDSSGNGYDLQVVGDVTLAPSPLGGMRAKLGTDKLSYLKYETEDEVTFPPKVPSGAKSVTITAWFESDDSTPDVAPISFWGSGSPANAMILDVSNIREYLRFVTLTSVGAQSLFLGFNSIVKGTPRIRRHFVAAVYNANEKKLFLYLDGFQAIGDAYTAASTCQPANFSIGGRFDRSDVWFKGYLDEVKVYATALTKTQVRAAMRLENQNDQSHSIIPQNATPVIENQATLAIEGANQVLEGVTGEGTLNLAYGSLTLTGTSEFAGKLTGKAPIILKTGASFTVADSTGYDGLLVLSGGSCANALTADAVIPAGTTLALPEKPFANVSGTLTVGENVTLTWQGEKLLPSVWEIVRAGKIELPENANWQLQPQDNVKGRTKLSIRKNSDNTESLIFRVIGEGSMFILR